MGSPRASKWLIGGPPLAYLLLLFAIPALIMLVASFRHAGQFGGLAPLVSGAPGAEQVNLTFDNYARFFGTFLYTELLLKSLLYALITTVICLVMAYPLALLIARSPTGHRELLVLLVILPFWSNFLIRVYAWIIILGPQSVLVSGLNAATAVLGLEPVRLLYTPTAVVIGLVYVHLPFMVLPLYANLEKHDPALLDAAQDLGAGAWQRFWQVTFPLSMPGVYAGAVLVFIPAFGIFAVPDLLGGTGGSMIGNVIKQQFLDSRDWPFGSVLSMVLTAVALVIAGVAAWFARRSRQ
ncbi:MAG TPA: ABC transporter permease [Vicinamibacterales bacterium]